MSAQTFCLEHLETPTGRLLVVTDAECRLRAVDWEDHHSRMQELLDRYYGAGTRLREARRLSQAARALADYFAGDLDAIADLPTAANGTAFQLSVWAALRQIPVGETVSYGALAARIGRPKAVRAVGLANGANPDRHCRPLPSRDRRRRFAHRVWRRPASQTLVAGARVRRPAAVRRTATGGRTMTAKNSKHVVLAAWQALASRDPQRIAAMFAKDAEWLAPQGNATAIALNSTSHMIGREQIAQSFGSDIWKLFTANVKVEFRGVYADGDVVIVEERMQATLANGNAYDNDYCFVFEVENGLIRRVREYMDTAKGHRMIFATDRSKS